MQLPSTILLHTSMNIGGMQLQHSHVVCVCLTPWTQLRSPGCARELHKEALIHLTACTMPQAMANRCLFWSHLWYLSVHAPHWKYHPISRNTTKLCSEMSQHCRTCRNMSLEFSYPFIAGASTFLILFRHPFWLWLMDFFSTVKGLESHSSRHGTDMVPPTFHEVNPMKRSRHVTTTIPFWPRYPCRSPHHTKIHQKNQC